MMKSAIKRYKTAIRGTTISAALDTRLMPPKIIGAVKITRATPT